MLQNFKLPTFINAGVLLTGSVVASGMSTAANADNVGVIIGNVNVFNEQLSHPESMDILFTMQFPVTGVDGFPVIPDNFTGTITTIDPSTTDFSDRPGPVIFIDQLNIPNWSAQSGPALASSLGGGSKLFQIALSYENGVLQDNYLVRARGNGYSFADVPDLNDSTLRNYLLIFPGETFATANIGTGPLVVEGGFSQIYNQSSVPVPAPLGTFALGAVLTGLLAVRRRLQQPTAAPV